MGEKLRGAAPKGTVISLWSNQGNAFAFRVRSRGPGASPPSPPASAFRRPNAH